MDLRHGWPHRSTVGTVVDALIDFLQFLGYSCFCAVIGAWLGIFWVKGGS